jgi:hypothetical protein
LKVDFIAVGYAVKALLGHFILIKSVGCFGKIRNTYILPQFFRFVNCIFDKIMKIKIAYFRSERRGGFLWLRNGFFATVKCCKNEIW